MLNEYKAHVDERQAQNIPPLPLDADQTSQLVDLLKSDHKESELLLHLLKERVPAGVDQSAYRSKEAKALDIGMGVPWFKVKDAYLKNGGHVFSSNFALYGDMSARVMHVLETIAPSVEVYSIDEAFINLTGFEHHDFNNYGKSIRQRILKWTGIPTCVGIAPTKALCKVANKIARKFPKKTGGSF